MQTNPHRPKDVRFLKVKRWMPRIRFQESESPICDRLNFDREGSISKPKIWGRAVLHNSVERPPS